MATFGDIHEQPAPMVLKLTPADFASDWHNKPVAPIEIGIRLPSENDSQTARIQADRHVASMELTETESRLDAWNDALMRCSVARCFCDPADVTRESPFMPLAEDTIGDALTSKAIQRCFDAIEKLLVSQSPLVAEATDEELARLGKRLLRGDHENLHGANARGLRRFARYCLDYFPSES